MSALWSNDVNEVYDKYSAISKDISEAKKGYMQRSASGEDSGSLKGEWKERVESRADYASAMAFDALNTTFKDLSKSYVESKTPEEANLYRDVLKWFKPKMVECIECDDEAERKTVEREMSAYLREFYRGELKRVLER